MCRSRHAAAHLFSELYTRAVPVQPDDLTAKARIREAALELFASGGIASTSLRSVAARAGVSPSLITHHFGSKMALRKSVDAAVLDAFDQALASVEVAGSPEAVSDQINTAIAGIIGGDRAVREYIGRSLVEATDASQQLFDSLTDLIIDGLGTLESAGFVRRGTDETWRAYAVLFIILGPILLGRQLEARLDTDAFAPEVVAARSASNVDLMRHGLFTADQQRAPRPRT